MHSLTSWKSARSLNDFALLTIEWLRGNRPDYPLYGESPDPETNELLPDLILLNQRGLLSTFSQPAEKLDANGSGQRAAFQGLASETLARKVATLTLHTDLLIFIYEPGAVGGYMVPITVWQKHPYTWCGSVVDFQELGPLLDVSSPAGAVALLSAWTVVAIDPRWGRKRYLWSRLRAVTNPRVAIDWSSSPSPDLGLETDFVR